METIDFLLARPLALFVVLVIGAAIGMGVERIANHFAAAKRKAYWAGRNAAKGKHKPGAKVVPIDRADRKATPLKLISPPTSSRSSAPPPSLRGRCSTGQRRMCSPHSTRR